MTQADSPRGHRRGRLLGRAVGTRTPLSANTCHLPIRPAGVQPLSLTQKSDRRIAGGIGIATVPSFVPVGDPLPEAAGVIRIGPAFVAVGIGMSAVLAWGIGYAKLAWQGHPQVASRSVAGWALAAAVSFVASSIAWPTLGVAAWSVVGVVLLVSWVGWWVALGRDLIHRAAATAKVA
ncbi:MAG: hypothetical protein ACRDHD_00035 [Candidatus Limnocylindria bacterium]